MSKIQPEAGVPASGKTHSRTIKVLSFRGLALSNRFFCL
ncbi:MAG: hypothetical protein RL257_903, partial [Actinomycetota bacterium]